MFTHEEHLADDCIIRVCTGFHIRQVTVAQLVQPLSSDYVIYTAPISIVTFAFDLVCDGGDHHGENILRFKVLNLSP